MIIHEFPPQAIYKFRANQLPLADCYINITATRHNIEMFVAAEAADLYQTTMNSPQNSLNAEQLHALLKHLGIEVLTVESADSIDSSLWTLADQSSSGQAGISQFTFANDRALYSALFEILEHFKINFCVETMDFQRSLKFFEDIKSRMNDGKLSTRKDLEPQLPSAFALCLLQAKSYSDLKQMVKELSEIKETQSRRIPLNSVSPEYYLRLQQSAIKKIDATGLSPEQIQELISLAESDVLKEYLRELELRVTPLNGSGFCFNQIARDGGILSEGTTNRMTFTQPSATRNLIPNPDSQFQIYDIFENVEFVNRLTYLREIVFQMNLCLPASLRLNLIEGNLEDAVPVHRIEVLEVSPAGQPQPLDEPEPCRSDVFLEYPEDPTSFSDYCLKVLDNLFPDIKVSTEKVNGYFFASAGTVSNLTALSNHPKGEDLLTRILSHSYLQGQKLANGFEAYRNPVRDLVNRTIEAFGR
jgi:hypothetical protein